MSSSIFNRAIGDLLLFAHNHESQSPFYKYIFPSELLRKILGFEETSKGQKFMLSDFSQAMHYVVYSKFEKLKAMLDENPLLIYLRNDDQIVTAGGLIIRNNSTLLECSLAAGDFEMAEMILDYFNRLECGQNEKEKQLLHCRSFINTLHEQRPYDLTKIISIIQQSTSEEIQSALNKVHIKDPENGSELDRALKKFRDDVRPNTLTNYAMHYNYQTLIHAFKLFSEEWNNLIIGHHNCDANMLFWRQIIGFLQRSLPVIDRITFAKGIFYIENKGLISLRVNKSRYYQQSFPDCSADDGDFSGLGFDFAVWSNMCSLANFRSMFNWAETWAKSIVRITSYKIKNLQQLVGYEDCANKLGL